MALQEKLKKYIKKLEESPNYVNPEQSLEIEKKEFTKLYQNPNDDEIVSYKTIPKFHQKLPGLVDKVALKLREEARSNFLKQKSLELLDDKEMKNLMMLLCIDEEGKAKDRKSGRVYYLTYPEFKNIGEKAEPKYKPFFTASVFAKLQKGDQPGLVMAMSVFNYVMRKIWLRQTRIGLSLYDPTGQGYLREEDLQNYILELMPSIPALEGLASSFSSFYVCTASRKFFFFLDPLRTGRIKISSILASNLLDDMVELREAGLPKEVQEMNWFSAASSLRVYGQYLHLDKNHNGMLSLNELQEYGSGTLTKVFLSRVFQQCRTYDGEIDFKTYLDLVLALEHRREAQSLRYLFQLLDIHSKGYLDSFTLNYFFKAIQDQLILHDMDPVTFEDVKNEILDKVRPADSTKITLKDLVACGQGGTVVSILIEFQCFVAYEHRESWAADFTF